MVWDLETQLPFPPIKKYQTIPSLPTERFFPDVFKVAPVWGKGGFGTVGHTFCRGLGWARDHHSVSVLFLLRHENPKDSVAHEKVRSIYFPRQEILSWTLPSTLAWFVPTFVKIMCKWVIPPSIWLSTQHSPFLTRSGERNLTRPFHSHAWVSCCWNLYARTNPLPSLKLMMQVDTGQLPCSNHLHFYFWRNIYRQFRTEEHMIWPEINTFQ